MITTLLFDIDGVLVEAKHLHYVALNEALAKYGCTITPDEHVREYNGLPTRKKLAKLTAEKGLREEYHQPIWELKQQLTEGLISKTIKEEKHITSMLRQFKQEGYTIGVCSNAIRRSCEQFLKVANLEQFVEMLWSNEDITNPKPDPEVYLTAMNYFRVTPEETIIIEDSPVGLKSAYASKAHVCAVENTKDCTYEKVKQRILEVEQE